MAKLVASDYMTPEVLRRRERRARARRDTEHGIAFLCYAYAAPGANPYLEGLDQDPQARAEGAHRGNVLAEVSRMFDAQLMVSITRFRDRIMAELFPHGTEWANLEPGDDYDPETAPDGKDSAEASERAEAREENLAALEPIQRMAFQDLHRSNFSEQAPDAIMDACIWRRGVLMVRRTQVGEASSALSFEHVSQAECSFEWSPNGDCWAIYRRHWFNRDEALWAWSDATGMTFPEGQDGKDDPEARTAFTEATYRVRGKKPWAYQVIQDKGDGGSTEVFKDEFPRNPYIVFGVNSAPGSRLGRSLVEMALPTARSLNALARINLEASEFRATPIYTAQQGGVPNTAQMRTTDIGIIVPVQSNDQNALSLRALDVPGDVDLGWSSQERMQMSVKQITMDMSLPEEQPQPRTKFEIQVRLRELQNVLGPIFNRLMSGLGTEVLQHVLDALFDLKEIEGMNREGGQISVVELDGRQVKVDFVNPLAQSQRMTDVEDVLGGVQRLNEIMPPELVASALNLEWIAEWAGRQLSWPEEAYRPKAQAQGLAEQALASQVMGTGQPPGGGAGMDKAGPSMMGGMPQA